MKIDIEEISEAQRNDSFWKQHAAFQIRYDKLEMDIREKFRLCLHEAGHMVYIRRLGWSIKKLHGPHMKYRDGELHTVLGAVTPLRGDFIIQDNWLFLDWEIAKSDIAGFVLVEALMGQPDKEAVIDGDMRTMSAELKTTPERRQQAVKAAKRDILHELNTNRPDFLEEIGSALREYERELFHTEETWLWAWKEFRLDLPGERYAVALPSTGGFGMLLDGDTLKLFVDGKEVAPHDQINFCDAVVLLTKPCKKGAADVVRRWNDAVRTATPSGGSYLADKPCIVGI